MRKILFAYQFAILGGVSTQLKNRAEALSKYVDVHFVFLSDLGGTPTLREVGTVHIVSNYNEFAQLLTDHNFYVISVIDTNIVHTWLAAYKFTGMILNETHTTYPQHLNKVIELKEYRIDKFLTPSLYMKNQLVEQYRFSEEEIAVLENCLDVSLFKRLEVPRVEQPIIIWIGKLDNHKNWQGFLDIISKLQEINLDFHFYVVGGYTAQAETVNEFYNKIVSLKIPENVFWLPYIEYEKMPFLYSTVKSSGGVYVSTSTNESFGMTVIEAMSVGVTTISPKVGALPELYDENNVDLLYPFFYVDEVVQIIIENINRDRIYNIDAYSTNHFAESFCKLIHL